MQHIVGADAHIGPFRSCEFAKILCGTGLPCRADVGIGPYSGNMTSKVLSMHSNN